MNNLPDVLSARSVTFYRNKHRIIQEVSLTMTGGECVAIVGPNGAGKSSLLKIFSGDLVPQTGEVLLNDIPLSAWERREIARRRAVLPQQSELLFSLPVREVVLMGRSPYHTGKETVIDEQIVEEAMLTTDIVQFGHRPYDQLSGGQKQRVQLARILVQVWPHSSMNGGFLLLDEPTSSLDLSHQHLFLQTVRRFTHVGLGALIVLHDLNLAMQYADRVMVLHEGSNIVCEVPERALHPQLIRKVFNVDVHLLHSPRLSHPVLVPMGG